MCLILSTSYISHYSYSMSPLVISQCFIFISLVIPIFNMQLSWAYSPRCLKALPSRPGGQWHLWRGSCCHNMSFDKVHTSECLATLENHYIPFLWFGIQPSINPLRGGPSQLKDAPVNMDVIYHYFVCCSVEGKKTQGYWTHRTVYCLRLCILNVISTKELQRMINAAVTQLCAHLLNTVIIIWLWITVLP